MSAIFGERLTFGQAKGPEVRLVTFGDENYARYETVDGFTAVYDEAAGQFCYAVLGAEGFNSSGVPVTAAAPAGIRRHIEEPETVRKQKHNRRRQSRAPRNRVSAEPDRLLTIGPNEGLLEGRRLSTGSVRGLTILVEFQDVTSTVTQADVQALLNGQNYTNNGNFCSAREYFRIVSSGKLDYSNDVVGPFKLSKPRAHYVNNLLVEEALTLAVNSGVDLRRYDSRNEGIVDALNILYAGQTQYQGDLWPHNWSINLQFGGVRTDLYLLTSMGRHSGDLSIGTFCHENGHLLCRFPDMYDYGDRDEDGVESAGIGMYCLMGAGNHLNNGRTPSPVCAYLRELAGWCDRNISLNQTAGFEATHGDYRTVMKFKTDKPNEYFIVENRSKVGLDQHLPASGLAVYHCDTKGSNEWQEGSSTRHYQCALLQADGHLDLERNINQGDGTDLFATIAGTALSHASKPSSRQWDGADSGLALSQVDPPGDTMKFRIGSAEGDHQIARGESTARYSIPDNKAEGISSTIKLIESGTARSLKVSVDIGHTFVGDLIVELVSPAGAVAVLHSKTGGGTDNLVATYDSISTPTLAVMAGQGVQGHWTLRVRDVAGQDVGTLNRWSIEVELEGSQQAIKQEVAPGLAIPDRDPAGIASVMRIQGSGAIDKINVTVDVTHTYIGDLRIELVSPSLRRVVLHSQLGGGQDNLVITYNSETPGSPLAALIAQPIEGDWVLRVADVVAVDTGRLNKWGLEIVPAR